MNFIKNLYFGEKAIDDQKKLLKDLKHKRYLPGVCLVALPTNEDNLLDIFEAYSLLQPGHKEKDVTVVGIAYGKDEAMEIVRLIVEGSYNSLGKVDINNYLGLE